MISRMPKEPARNQPSDFEKLVKGEVIRLDEVPMVVYKTNLSGKIKSIEVLERGFPDWIFKEEILLSDVKVVPWDASSISVRRSPSVIGYRAGEKSYESEYNALNLLLKGAGL